MNTCFSGHTASFKIGVSKIQDFGVLNFYPCIFEPRYEISKNVVCATSKGSDQPGHMRSLIRAFASRLTILFLLSY